MFVVAGFYDVWLSGGAGSTRVCGHMRTIAREGIVAMWEGGWNSEEFSKFTEIYRIQLLTNYLGSKCVVER